MSVTCTAFLPQDPKLAEDVIVAMYETALSGQFIVKTLKNDARSLDLDEIKALTTEQLQRFKSMGMLPLDRPEYVVFDEVGVSEAEGSTVDVTATVGTNAKLVIRIHHGRDNQVTYHLPRVRAIFDNLVDPSGSFMSLSSASLVNSLISTYRMRYRHDEDMMASLTERMTLVGGRDSTAAPGDAKSEARRILDELARQRSGTGT